MAFKADPSLEGDDETWGRDGYVIITVALLR
jgi:hypothetical protein